MRFRKHCSETVGHGAAVIVSSFCLGLFILGRSSGALRGLRAIDRPTRPFPTRPAPAADLAAGVAFHESLEGRLVTVENPLVTGPTNRFGEIEAVASGGAGAAGQPQTITVPDFFDSDISDVGVSFGNDLYAGTPLTDRNLKE